MFILEVDTSGIREIKAAVEDIQENRVGNLIPAASFATVTIKDRIEHGKNVSGKIMETKSKKKTGKYSRRHGNKRKNLGKRTDVINLNLTGNTQRQFGRVDSFSAFKEDAVELGFKTADAEIIAGYNNEMFDDPYDISTKEIDGVFTEYIDNFGNNILLK